MFLLLASVALVLALALGAFRVRSFILAAGLSLLAALTGAGVALAQTVPAAAPVFSIDFAPIVNGVVIPLLSTVLLGVAGWAMTWVGKHFRFQVQTNQRALVDQMIVNEITAVQSLLAGKENVPASQVVTTAANFVMAKIPAALNALNITPARLEQLIAAKLPS